MQVACDACEGSGYVSDTTGHPDICGKCWGLGSIAPGELEKDAREDEFEKTLNREFRIVNYIYAAIIGAVLVLDLIVLTLLR